MVIIIVFIQSSFTCLQKYKWRTKLAQMVACLPLVQQVRGSIPSRVVNFHLKIFNPGARRGGDVQLSKWIAGKLKHSRSGHLLMLSVWQGD